MSTVTHFATVSLSRKTLSLAKDIKEKTKKMGKERVISGVNQIDAELDGKSVAEIRSMLSQPLNIDPASRPVVNGENVDETYCLVDGDELEFVKASGEKGC